MIPSQFFISTLCRYVVRQRRLTTIGTSILALAASCLASVNVTLTPSIPSGAPVGATIIWQAHASDTTDPKATFQYRFSIGRSGGPLQVRRDFYTFTSFPWTPVDAEGSFDVQVAVRSSTGATGTATDSYLVSSRITGSGPVLSPTKHPLVALYSMPVCNAGYTARVRFKLPSDTVWQTTLTKSCNGLRSLNFYVAGMRASTTYEIQHDVFNGPFNTPGPVLNFTTKPLPDGLPIPAYTVVKPMPPPNDTAYPVLLASPSGTIPYATDSSGRIIWYLRPPNVTVALFTRPVPGGTFLVITFDTSRVRTRRLLREYDLAGNLIRETSTLRISEQLVASNADPITSIHHDVVRLPDGKTAFIASVEKVANQGAGPVDVLGDQVVVVDTNLQVVWSWNEFNYLDIMRPAVLHETCRKDQLGCPPLLNPNYSIANDWTHSNGLALAPDGNMVISSRHQDWVMKFRYQNGKGDGTLLWRLGPGGDFKISSTDPHPWFTHQHNPEFEPNGQLTLFDNGNTRIRSYGGNSRGQSLRLDEANMVATLPVNIDLGNFSFATGSAQALSNGNYTFNLGYVSPGSATREYMQSGALVSAVNSNNSSYRSFRMRSLYQEK